MAKGIALDNIPEVEHNQEDDKESETTMAETQVTEVPETPEATPEERLVQLKAMAYDRVLASEKIQADLRQINEAINTITNQVSGSEEE